MILSHKSCVIFIILFNAALSDQEEVKLMQQMLIIIRFLPLHIESSFSFHSTLISISLLFAYFHATFSRVCELICLFLVKVRKKE